MKFEAAWRQLRRLFDHTPRQTRIHLYAVAWNEECMLPFFFRHYDQFVDRYVIYDDNSTDATLAMLHAHPRVEVRSLDRPVPDSFVLSVQPIFNSHWKESRGNADWVIIADIDEHLYHPDLATYLTACKQGGVSAIPALGYEMISDTFPQGERRLCELVRKGEPASYMSKLLIFDPNRLTETDFAVGRHSAEPKGKVRYPKVDRLLNLHFKSLGLDYVIARYRLLASRRGARDRANKWGYHYDAPAAEIAETFKARLDRTFDVIAAGDRADDDHQEPRWWRL
jgi:hypothetical protein